MKKHTVLFALAVIAFLVIVWKSDLDSVYAALSDFRIGTLVFLCLVQLSKYLLMSLQWKSLVQASGHHISLGTMTHIIMSGKFVECITPGFKVGGEITKTTMLRDNTEMSTAEAVAVTAAQKTLNVLGFMLLCLASLVFIFQNGVATINASTRYILLVSTGIAFTLCSLAVVIMLRPTRLDMLLPRNGLGKFRSTIKLLLKRPLWLLAQMLLTLVIWSNYAFVSVVTANVIGLDLSSLYVIVVTYLSYMLGMIPLLPGGLGTTEAGLTGLLAIFAVPVTSALAMTLVLRFITYWFLLFASLLWVLSSKAGGYVLGRSLHGAKAS